MTYVFIDPPSIPPSQGGRLKEKYFHSLRVWEQEKVVKMPYDPAWELECCEL